MMVLEERLCRGADPAAVAALLGHDEAGGELLIVIADTAAAVATRPDYVTSDLPEQHRKPSGGWAEHTSSTPPWVRG